MEGILNFDKELDVALLDRVVQTFFTGRGAEVRAADRCQRDTQNHPY